MSITGIVERDMVKLSVHVPDGTTVEIILPEEPASRVKAKPWMELAGCLKAEGEELRRIDRVIEEEFERINPDDWR